jgi:DNA mismatch repair protein MutS2
LMEIHERTRSVREQMRRRLEAIVRDRELERIVQEDYITLRNDRYVILLRPEFKGLLDGIVHDHSRSGASVYVEPFSVVELNNQTASLIDEERDEIRRIFAELTEEIRSVQEIVFQNYRALAQLDALQARALYARATSSIVPVLVPHGFRILGARHPLLLAADPSQVVPMDVIQGSTTVASVISGANMGGKTVALKIAGLFPLMTRCWLMLPAREGTEIHLFDRVMADIGEEQDIRSRISSFSGHVTRMKEIVGKAGRGDLVLLDELGGATDPEEGAALAMAVMDTLVTRGARVMATTHLTQLKAYALGRDDMTTISVEFHPETLKPTFRLLYDLPGESHAIATAERMGLAPHVIAAARDYLDKAAGGSARLLTSLRQKMSEVEGLRSEVVEKERILDSELSKIRSQKDEAVDEFRKRAGEMVRKAEREIADLQESIKSGKMKRAQEIRETMRRIKSEITETLGTPLEKRITSPEVGARVKVKNLGREGTVKAVAERGPVEVRVGNVTVRVDPEDVILLGEDLGEKSSSKNVRIAVDIPPASPRWQVNVIGLRVDDALPIVDKALDEAVLGGLASMSIIHGKGTGRLKKAIWEHLSRHALVRDLQPGDSAGGGAGVTVVNLVLE